MVNLTIVVEGGAPMGDPSADTANNTESLRESFYKFFSAVLNRDDIAITVYMASGYKAAAKQYIQGHVDSS